MSIRLYDEDDVLKGARGDGDGDGDDGDGDGDGSSRRCYCHSRRSVTLGWFVGVISSSLMFLSICLQHQCMDALRVYYELNNGTITTSSSPSYILYDEPSPILRLIIHSPSSLF